MLFPARIPARFVKFEGMELYWMQHLAGGAYELTGNTVTFFRDVNTGAMLSEFRNPYTKVTNPVTPAVQGGGPGRGFNYSTQGIRFTRLLDQLPEDPLVLDWTFARDMVWLHNWTRYPPGLPPPALAAADDVCEPEGFSRREAGQRAGGLRLHRAHAVAEMARHGRPPRPPGLARGRRQAEVHRRIAGRVSRPDGKDYPALLSADPAKAAERVTTPKLQP